ncbi:MAG TPA: IS110 family transposase [Acidimicrobiales bacterium]|nr:IS110 family transposase [Acidimicrobiales bacterium]
MGQYVGIDLHRRSTTIHRMTEDGETLGVEKILSQPFELAQAISAAGPEPEVVLESTYGWYWAADVLKECGAHVHLAHALGNNWGNRRVKNDKRDAADLALMLRIGRLSEGWIAPPEIRELRELVRYRHSLGRHRTSAKAQIHGVMAKNGILPVVGELWGPIGQAQLDSLELTEAYALRMRSLRELLAHVEREITKVDAQLHHRLKSDAGYRALVRLPGVGKVLGAVFVAEIGDISRFDSAKKLSSWAGLTPKHKESDEVVRRGAITKQGSRLVRWAAIEAVGNYRAKGNEKLRADYRRIAERRGKYKARVAVARKLVTLVFYALRDGEVRCLDTQSAA